jgi:hypothetical protein
MTIKLNSTKILEHKERPIALGATIESEGVPLVRVFENGSEHVTPATGGGGEVFVGFSWMHNIVPSVVPFVETIKVPGAGKAQEVYLTKNNLVADMISIMNGATQMTEDTPGPPAVINHYSVTDASGLVVFDPAETNAGDTLIVTYMYSPSVAEAKALYRHSHINIQPAFEFLRSIGVITIGEIFTDQYDAAIDWSAAATIDLGAGIVTEGGGGDTIQGHVTHVPTADNPYLGIQFANH